MAKKRMQVGVDEVITGQCPDCKVHSGISAEMKAVCIKLDEKYDRINEKIEDRERLGNLRFESLKESIDVAKQTMDARLQGMNQLTHQLDLQRQETKEKMLELTNTFLPKERFDAEHKTFSITINAKIEALVSGILGKMDTAGKDVAALQSQMSAKREGMKWVEYVITVLVSFGVFVLARFVFKF